MWSAGLVTALACAALWLPGGAPASAHEAGAVPERQTLLVLLPGMAFEDFMAYPEMRQLARAGGAGLLSTRPEEEGWGSFLTLGAGARMDSQADSLDVEITYPEDCGEPAHAPCVGVGVVAPEQMTDATDDGRLPGLLGQVLWEAGHSVSVGLTPPGSIGNPEALVAMDRSGRMAVSEELLPLAADLSVISFSDLPARTGENGKSFQTDLAMQLLRTEISAATTNELQIIVLAANPPGASPPSEDYLTPIVLAQGYPPGLFPANGEMHTLTSDSTHRVGVVSNEDVAPTVLQFLGESVPSEMLGSPIRTVDAPVPFRLHARYLDNICLRETVQVAAGGLLLLLGGALFVCAWLRRRGSVRAGLVGAWLSLTVPLLGASLLAAGSLPVLNGWTVGGFVLLVPLGVAAIAIRFRHRGELVPPAIVGGAILAYMTVELAAGSPSMLTTFLGGTGLDGARFYGIPNVDVGLVLGAVMWIVPSIRRTWVGFALIFAAGLLVGLPWFGANHEVGMFVAAGAWLALGGSWRRVTWRGVLVVLGVTALGLVAIFGADLVTATPTHGTRFLTGHGGVGVIEKLWDRLTIGLRLLALNPVGILYLAALPVVLFMTIRPGPRLGRTLERQPRWRVSMAITLAACIVAFFANDTGVSAVGLGFAAAAMGLAYMSLVAPPEKIGEQ